MYSNLERYISDRKPPMGAVLNPYLSINQGLVLDSIMWEGAGPTVEDLSGNGNDGTLQGTAPLWTSGKFGSAVLLPGTDEYINVGNIDLSSSEGITVLAWVYNKDIAKDGTVVGRWGESGERQFLLYMDTDGLGQGYRVLVRDEDGLSSTSTSAHSANAIQDKWQHVGFTYDGANLTLYVDSVLIETVGGGVGLQDIPNSIGIGSDEGDAAARVITGIVDLPMIYNRALSAGEIAELCLNPFCGFRWTSIEQLAAYIEIAPPEIKALFMDLSTQLWTIKHSQGIFTKL